MQVPVQILYENKELLQYCNGCQSDFLQATKNTLIKQTPSRKTNVLIHPLPLHVVVLFRTWQIHVTMDPQTFRDSGIHFYGSLSNWSKHCVFISLSSHTSSKSTCLLFNKRCQCRKILSSDCLQGMFVHTAMHEDKEGNAYFQWNLFQIPTYY